MSKTIVSDGSEDLLQSFLSSDAPVDLAPLEDLAKPDTTTPVEKGEEDFNGEILTERDIDGILEEAPVEDDKTEGDDAKDDVETESDEPEYNFKAVVSYLNEEGAVDFEIPEDAENSPEIIKEAVIKTADKMVSQYKESLPEVVQDLVDYLEKGGKPENYLNALQRDIDLDNIDLEDVNNQKTLVSEYLKLQGLEDGDIDETIQGFEDGLILDKQAKIASKQLEKYYANRTSQLVKEQEVEHERAQKEYTKQIQSIKKEITDATTLAGLPISKEQKSQFEDYFLKVGKDGLSQYGRELQENPIKTSLELAWLKFNKYDFAKATAEAKKEINKNLKDVFKKSETTTKGKSGDSSKPTKANDFSAFNKFFGK